MGAKRWARGLWLGGLQLGDARWGDSVAVAGIESGAGGVIEVSGGRKPMLCRRNLARVRPRPMSDYIGT